MAISLPDTDGQQQQRGARHPGPHAATGSGSFTDRGFRGDDDGGGTYQLWRARDGVGLPRPRLPERERRTRVPANTTWPLSGVA